MDKIKVLQLVEDLKIGGAEKVIADIALGIDKGNFESHIWCLSKGGSIADELKEKGASVKILGISSYFNPLNILKLATLLKKAKPDIVHTHGYFASVIGRIAANYARVPVLFNHVHSTYWDYKKRNLFIEKLLSKHTQTIICCSEAVRNFVTKNEKIDPSKTIVIYNGVDVERFSNSKYISAKRMELGINPNDPVIGTVSSLTPHKGHKYLLLAAREILETFSSTKFLFVGDGGLKEELEDQAKNLNIFSNVIFTGTRKNIPELLNLIDIFVLPSSSREGLGISIIEAMAVEKPVVATNIGGVPEVVEDGKTGILVPPKNPEALAGAVIELLNNPGKTKEMGRLGRLRIKEKFTTGNMISEIEILYRSLFSQKSES
jgi:glycosyltransferase involved in cell wall biosynthesis